MVWVVLFAIGIQALLIAFIDSSTVQVYASSPLLNTWLQAFHQNTSGFYISLVIVFILSLVAGFSYNSVINNNEVLFRQSFFPALFYFYLTHLYGSQNLINPQFIASILCGLLVYKYLALDPRNIRTTPFLDMGVFISLAFCVLPESIFFLPTLIIALLLAGYLTFKNFLLFLTGLSIPLYFIGLIYFLLDDWNSYLTLYNFDFLYFDMTRFVGFSWVDYTTWGYILFVLLISLLTLQPNIAKNTIRTRRAQQLLLLFLLSGIAGVVFSRSPVNQSLTLLALPLSPFLSYYFLRTKRAFWRETLFALFFIILIIAQIAVTI